VRKTRKHLGGEILFSEEWGKGHRKRSRRQEFSRFYKGPVGNKGTKHCV